MRSRLVHKKGLVHVYACSGKALWFYLHTPCEDGETMSYYGLLLPLAAVPAGHGYIWHGPCLPK